jgi:hypothetical protein
VKLFRGPRTLVHRRLWPAVDVLAGEARERLLARSADDVDRRVLVTVEASPGIPLGELRRAVRIERRVLDRAKRNLEERLAVFGRERDDVEHHTHEPALFPWRDGPIARGTRSGGRPDSEHAITVLMAAAGAAGELPDARLFPVVKP